MLHDRLAAAERTGNRCDAALCNREQRIDDALTGYHRLVGRELFCVRSALSDRPLLQHRQEDFLAVLFELRDRGDDIRFALEDPRQLAGYVRRNHDLVQNRFGLLYRTENVAAFELVADLRDRYEVPKLFVIERIDHDAARNAVARLLTNLVQGTLNAVVD